MVSSVLQERRDAALEILVDLLRAADEAHRREAVAPVVERLVRGRDHLGVRRQPEVVVGAEIDDFAARDLDGGGLRALDARARLCRVRPRGWR